MQLIYKESMKTISEKTNLSISTIWRAANNQNSVKEDTLKKLKPYFKLSSPQKITKIYIVVPDLTNHFFSSVVQGVVTTARLKQIETEIFLTLDNKDIELDIINSLPVDITSVMVWIPTINCLISRLDLEKNDFLFAIVDRIQPEINSPITIAVDNFQLAYRATSLLIEGHCDNIIMITGHSSVPSYSQREGGFLKAINEYGVNGRVIHLDDNTPKGAYEKILVEPIRENKINGILSTTGYMVLGILEGLAQKNIKVGEDIGLITFDSHNNIRNLFKISNIFQPAEEMGSQAVELLISYDININPNIIYYNNAYLDITGSEKIKV